MVDDTYGKRLRRGWAGYLLILTTGIGLACGSVGSNAKDAGSGGSGGSGSGGSTDAATGGSGGGAQGGAGGGQGGSAAGGSGGSSAGGSGGGTDAGAGDTAAPGDGGADAGAWTPARLSGLALWLSADTGVAVQSNKVTTWSDQSGHNNTATQSAAAAQPTLVAGAVNGHAVISFGVGGAATFLQVADAATLNWGTGDFLIEVVGSFTQSAATYGLIYSKQKDNLAPYVGASLWANYGVSTRPSPTTFGVQLQGTDNYVTNTATANLNDGTTRLYGGRRAGAMLEARLNGAQSGMTVLPTPALDVSSPGYFLFIGGHPMASTVIQALTGNIAEIVAVSGTVTPAELTQLESYLRGKYGL